MKYKKTDFFNSIYSLYNNSKSFFLQEKIKEEFFLNYLNYLEENLIENEYLKNNFSIIYYKNFEKLINYSKPYNLILLPFEGLKIINSFFVKFLIYSTLSRDFIGAFGFNPFNNDFFYTDLFHVYYNKKNNINRENKILIERKKFNEDLEIKSRSFLINFFYNFYQNLEKEVLFLYSPNYSLLLTSFGVFEECLCLGYDFNKLDELFFFNIFLEKNNSFKEKIKKEVLLKDLPNFYRIKKI